MAIQSHVDRIRPLLPPSSLSLLSVLTVLDLPPELTPSSLPHICLAPEVQNASSSLLCSLFLLGPGSPASLPSDWLLVGFIISSTRGKFHYTAHFGHFFRTLKLTKC